MCLAKLLDGLLARPKPHSSNGAQPAACLQQLGAMHIALGVDALQRCHAQLCGGGQARRSGHPSKAKAVGEICAVQMQLELLIKHHYLVQTCRE